MTHVLVFLAAMAALAAVLILAADRPGVVSIALPSTSTYGLLALLTLLSGVALVTLRRRG